MSLATRGLPSRRSRIVAGLLATVVTIVGAVPSAAEPVVHPPSSVEILGGGAAPHLWPPHQPLPPTVVDVAPAPTGRGYWVLAEDGTITGFGPVTGVGDALSHGDASGIAGRHRLLGLEAAPGRGGYWVVAADGGVFTYGDAAFHGSTGGMVLNSPVVGMAAARGAAGYWLVAADGGVFAFGGAPFSGSTGGVALAAPVVAMAPDPDGHGYWLVAADGGVFAFAADFHGSAVGSLAPGDRAVDVAASPGGGYWVATANGAVLAFGAAGDHADADTGITAPGRTVVAITAHPAGGGYWLATRRHHAAIVQDPPFSPSGAPPAPGAPVGYQGDARRTGVVDTDVARGARRRWERRFEGALLSTPLVVGDAVVLTVSGTRPDGSGTSVVSLDRTTGATRWERPLPGRGWTDFAGAAVHGDRVYALTGDGHVAALDLATGSERWTATVRGRFLAPPTPHDDGLYLHGYWESGGRLWRLDAATGAVRWNHFTEHAYGGRSSPTVDGGTVFVAGACAMTYGVDAASGARRWHHHTDCAGGGAELTVVDGGRLYVRDGSRQDVVLDAASGERIGTFQAYFAPAFGDGGGFFVDGTTLDARDAGTGELRWSLSVAYERRPVTAPLVTRGLVHVGAADGTVLSVDAATGQIVHALQAGAGMGTRETSFAASFSGLGAGGGSLVAVAGDRVVAFA